MTKFESCLKLKSERNIHEKWKRWPEEIPQLCSFNSLPEALALGSSISTLRTAPHQKYCVWQD
jgi:hypothetical protein